MIATAPTDQTSAPQPAPAPVVHPGQTGPPLTVIILTLNAQDSLPQVIASCKGLATRLLVVDSFSTDATVELAKAAGCEVVQHPFENYAAQRNWAQAHAALAADAWVLHLDADEVLSPELAASIGRALAAPAVDGYLMRRLSYFLGHPIRYGHMNPNWHLRLYRAGKGRCEDRLYDQHFILDGATERLAGVMHDLQLVSIERWTNTHNRWSTAEAAEIAAGERAEGEGRALEASLAGDPRMRKRWMKNRLYYRAPSFLRVFLFFLYSYVLKLGFLDGRTGFVYHVLHVFWFRFLVDAKLHELHRNRAAAAAGAKPPA
jgi:glycosyltransferase involved in cell wall biosynthesis